jgi:hypothetical protein
VLDWYNQHRPHSTLGGKTPDEVYFQRFPANRRPRIEPRPPGRVALRARCLTRWSPARQAPASTCKLSTSPGTPTCRLSDCDAPHSLIFVSELEALSVRASPPDKHFHVGNCDDSALATACVSA